MSKIRQLEIYLNSVEFGPGVYGINAATEHYFQKTPEELTIKETAFLIMVLPNPAGYSRSYNLCALTSDAQTRISRMIFRMKKKQRIDWNTYDLAMCQELWEQ